MVGQTGVLKHVCDDLPCSYLEVRCRYSRARCIVRVAYEIFDDLLGLVSKAAVEPPCNSNLVHAI